MRQKMSDLPEDHVVPCKRPFTMVSCYANYSGSAGSHCQQSKPLTLPETRDIEPKLEQQLYAKTLNIQDGGHLTEG